MITKYDKSLVALVVPLILYWANWLVTQTGYEMTSEVKTAMETILFWAWPIVSGVIVYAWPNKKDDEIHTLKD